MNRGMTWMLIATVALTSVGCVAQREADDLRTLYRKSQEQVLDLQARLEEANTRLAALQAAGAGDEALMQQLTDALAALEDAKAQIRALSQQSVLPPELDAALKQLAASNPDIMEYDPDLGMVKFRSDLTFALGSTQVSTAAQQTLGSLAGVLKSPAAMGYEVRVVGHTDNVPVSNPANRQRFGDNWGLSAFRAISVKNVLQSSSVSPTRIEIAGRGEFAPVVGNGAQGAEQNRRVEIFLVRGDAGGLAGAAATPENPAAAATEGEESFK